MPVLPLDPLVHGCSRRRARKVIRAARKHPLESISWNHRAYLLHWLRQHPVPLTEELLDALPTVFEIYPPSQWHPCEFKQFAAAVSRGVPPENLETWAWLRADGLEHLSLDDCPKTAFPLPDVAEWNFWARITVRTAWRLGASKLMADPRFAALPGYAQCWLLDVADRPPGDCWPLLDTLAAFTPEALEKTIDCDGVWAAFAAKLAPSTAHTLLQRWAGLRDVERKGARMAFDIEITIPTGAAERIAALSPAVFTRIGKARHNRQLWEETMIALGLLPAGLVYSALTTRPDLLFECGERLHNFGRVRAKALLRRLAAHPLFTERAGLIALDNLLTAHRDIAQTLPAFATWDLHWSGQKVISLPAIEDAARQLREGLAALRIRFLMQQVDTEISLHGDPHAGRLRSSLRYGRGPLTRFLRRFSIGDDSRLGHSANRRWLQSRPDFPIETWLHPLRITLPVSGLGDVTLEVETNPFEILRLGTYAKSCLAAGGCNSSNAVAVLLDINKRAIYARNAQGKFLARQIIAISETGHLVAHAVYPDKTPDALEDFFQLFVEDWALQLRLPIARGGYHEVVPLTLPYWYNDGLWQRYAVAESDA